ncbi:hypothetical protein C8Q75DRAFT_730469 [Abortiporus biennis]|nr:hypothetical protein C8Q75DRAFT_730469 [Abortiporus biennis]
MNGFGLLTRGPEYKPPANGKYFTRQEKEEWNDTHQPFTFLPRMYQCSGRKDSLRPIPTLHFAIKITTREAYDACIRHDIMFPGDEYESHKHYAVTALVRHLEKEYAWLDSLQEATTLTNSDECYILSLFTNKDHYRYFTKTIPVKLQRVMYGIEKILQKKEPWLWYWDSMESPVTGWYTTTHPEFAHCFRAREDDNNKTNNDDGDGDRDDTASGSSSAESDDDELTEVENEKRIK